MSRTAHASCFMFVKWKKSHFWLLQLLSNDQFMIITALFDQIVTVSTSQTYKPVGQSWTEAVGALAEESKLQLDFYWHHFLHKHTFA